MAIYEESRYETAEVVPVADQDGVFHATVIPTRVVVPTSDYTVHRVVAGDRLDSLATTAYDDPEFWWIIADANPELFYPDDLPPGHLLRIPRVVDTQ